MGVGKSNIFCAAPRRAGKRKRRSSKWPVNSNQPTPVYETLAGWRERLDDAESLADLPAAARAYVAFVEEQLGVEVCLISVGAERERVVAPRGLASVAG